MSMTNKNEADMTTSNFEVHSHDYQSDSKQRIYRTVDSARVGLTGLALAVGITILGLASDSIAVYNRTHAPHDFILSLWPKDFDIRPTTALVAGSAIVIVANVVSLLVSKIESLRNRAGVHTSLSLVAPVIGLIAALVGMGFFYTMNASTTVDTMQSWTCRWKHVSMLTEPHFDSMCTQNQAAMGLAIVLVPLEIIVLAAAGYQIGLEKKLDGVSHQQHNRKGASASPAFSH